MAKQLIVIGGGAAGFFCAVNAARINPALKVTIVEKSGKLLSKVKVSGGGRCNVTHACFDIGEMSRKYPRGGNFVKKAFHQFFTTDTIKWFEKRGVKLKAEKDGRMFPVSDSSQTIIDCLIKEANRYGVEVVLHAEVKNVTCQEKRFNIKLSDSRVLTSDYLCVASGGYPKPSMFQWMTELGHTIEEPVPSLFTFNLPQHPITKLMGVSIEYAKVKITGTKLVQGGPLLITHWGLSGPAVLKLSAWGARELAAKNYEFSVSVNWLPEYNEYSFGKRVMQLRTESASQKIITRNPFGLPARLWEFLAAGCGVKTEMRWADLPATVQNRLAKNICSYGLQVYGKTTFKEEFVTSGGIKLSEIDVSTMESRRITGLYFAGEVMDVDGITGGFNFQHAWTSGWIAAMAAACRFQ